MDCMSNFSKLLKELRESRRLKQSELAEKLGVSRGSISFYENGDRVPDIVFLYKMAEFFGVSCDYLLGFVNDSVFDADDRAISEATGLSGLAVSILKQSKYAKKLAEILNILIEEEFTYAYAFGDALEKHSNILSMNMDNILEGLEEEVSDFMKGLNEETKNDADVKEIAREGIKSERIIQFASGYYKPILTHLYNYLIGWKNSWTNNESKKLYVTADGEIKENEKKGILFQQDEVIEYALLFRIQDNIRALKSRRAMESKEESN